MEYRTVRFEEEIYDTANYQGNAVVNYTEANIPYTRIIEHKHFEMFGQEIDRIPRTVISKEYSTEWRPGMESYYPVNDKYPEKKSISRRGLYAEFFGNRCR